MRLHLNWFYALMLILLTNVLISNTCRGHVQKRAIDFDEIADFVDITEQAPAPLSIAPLGYVEHSIAKVRNLNFDIALPKEGHFAAPWSDDLRSLRKSHNEHSASTSASGESVLTTSSDVDRILSFRMKQFKHLPAPPARRNLNLYKRYVNLPVPQSGGSYIGHLADATHDVNLRMQNYAATMMVVLTTPRSTDVTTSKATSNLIEIKTIMAPPGREDDLGQTAGRSIKSDSSVATIAVKLEETSASTGAEHSSPSKDGTTHEAFTTRLSRIEDDYPLLGADGFYTENVDMVKDPLADREKRSKSGKRAKRETDYIDTDDSFVESGNFDPLLRMMPAKIIEDRAHDAEGEGPHKAKQPPIAHLGYAPPNSKHGNANHPPPREPITASLTANQDTRIGGAGVPAFGDQGQVTHSITHEHTLTTPNTNPYMWENDIIKELNIKFKKEIGSSPGTTIPSTSAGSIPSSLGTVSTAAIVTAGPSTVSVTGNSAGSSVSSTFPATASMTASSHLPESSSTASLTKPAGKVVRENADPSTAPPTVIVSPSSAVVQTGGGGTAEVPICKSKECQQLHSNFFVYNDTAGDCNKENDLDAGTGGYNIISNDETPTTPLLKLKCPINMTRTEPPSTKSTQCSEVKQGQPCEASNDDLDFEPCDVRMNQNNQKPCKKTKIKHHHRTHKPPDKRQVVNTPAINYLPPQNYFVQQQPALVQNSEIPHMIYTMSPTLGTTPYYTNVPQVTTLPNNLNVVSTFYANSMPMAPAAMLPPSELDRVFKKSADKNALSSVIDNLKIVDQKLADAVDPLHCAQEQLDAATKCDTTTSACTEACRSTECEGLMKDLSEAEKTALSRLALKIIANQNTKLKRSDGVPVLPVAPVRPVAPMVVAPPVMPVDQVEREMAKRGVVKMFPTPQPYEFNDYDDYGDQDRLSRLQRDISVAQEIELIVEHIKKRQNHRVKRNFLHKPARTRVYSENSEQSYDEFGARNFKNFLYEHEDPKLTRSLDVINTRVKNTIDDEDAYHKQPIKKTKSKKFWRKLFGLTSNRNNNRFLDQDIPNSQSIQESKKRKNI